MPRVTPSSVQPPCRAQHAARNWGYSNPQAQFCPETGLWETRICPAKGVNGGRVGADKRVSPFLPVVKGRGCQVIKRKA